MTKNCSALLNFEVAVIALELHTEFIVQMSGYNFTLRFILASFPAIFFFFFFWAKKSLQTNCSQGVLHQTVDKLAGEYSGASVIAGLNGSAILI